MFGLNPEGAAYTNDGYSPSFMNKMEDRLRPFRAGVSWLCHFIGRCPMVVYTAPSGPQLISPEKVIYNSEVVSPLAISNCALAVKKDIK